MTTVTLSRGAERLLRMLQESGDATVSTITVRRARLGLPFVLMRELQEAGHPVRADRYRGSDGAAIVRLRLLDPLPPVEREPQLFPLPPVNAITGDPA